MYLNIFFIVPKKLIVRKKEEERERELVAYSQYFRSQILFSLQLRIYDTIFRKV